MLLLTFEWWSENSSLRKFKCFFTVTNKLDVILMFNIELSQEKKKNFRLYRDKYATKKYYAKTTSMQAIATWNITCVNQSIRDYYVLNSMA